MTAWNGSLAWTVAKRGQQIPIGGCDKRHALAFALDNQPHRDALDPAGREPRADLPPQQRRNLVAEQPVDNPPRFLGSRQGVVDVARVLQRLMDRLAGDFVKHRPVDRDFRVQQLAEVPTDGLPLAVFVRRQVQFAGLLRADP